MSRHRNVRNLDYDQGMYLIRKDFLYLNLTKYF